MEYFVPKIEDIRIGYECEVKWYTRDNQEWRKFIVDLETINNMKSTQDVRTPYLTKEQIEAEGWKSKKGIKALSKEEGFQMYMIEGTQEIVIMQWEEAIFQGLCPSINEFRYICKLLKID